MTKILNSILQFLGEKWKNGHGYDAKLLARNVIPTFPDDQKVLIIKLMLIIKIEKYLEYNLEKPW